METLLEHIHIYTGTPWWGSILLTALVVRLALFKPYLGAADVSARAASIQPITAPIREKMMAAQRAGDQQGMLLARQELLAMHKRAGIKMYKAFTPLFQVFLGFGTFRLFRGMASLPVPGLETGGLLWLKDLTVQDPYYILPLATAGAFYLVMRVRIRFLHVDWELPFSASQTLFHDANFDSERRRDRVNDTVATFAEIFHLWAPSDIRYLYVVLAWRDATYLFRYLHHVDATSHPLPESVLSTMGWALSPAVTTSHTSRRWYHNT